MQDMADHIISMLLPVIAVGFDSFKTLNLLARTNKTISHAVKQNHLELIVANKSKCMTKKELRKLFVLSSSVHLSYQFSKSVYSFLPIVPKCRVLDAFRQAMAIHGSVAGMNKALYVRKRRSVAMKLVWVHKKELFAIERQARVDEIEQIKGDLCIIPCRSHVVTDAEMIYREYGVVRRMSRVYRNKRLFAIHSAGLLHTEEGTENNFLRVARLHMNDPDLATHVEKMFILRHSLAWEHFLFNYTSFTDVLHQVAGTVMDVDHVEFLFPLPTRWPFSNQVDEPSSQEFDTTDLPGLFATWMHAHDFLYQDK